MFGGDYIDPNVAHALAPSHINSFSGADADPHASASFKEENYDDFPNTLSVENHVPQVQRGNPNRLRPVHSPSLPSSPNVCRSPALVRPTRHVRKVDSVTLEDGFVKLNQYKLMSEIGQVSGLLTIRGQGHSKENDSHRGKNNRPAIE